MAIHTGKFVAELKRRYGSPKNVLARLGLDQDILAEFKPGNGNGTGGNGTGGNGNGSEGDAQLWKMRKAIEKAIEEAAKSNDISDKAQAEIGNVLNDLCPYGIKNSAAENAPAATDQEREKPLTDEGLEEAIRSYMESHEMSEREIEEAIARLRGARTAEAILDSTRLPKNAQQKGGYGGALGAMDSARSDRFAERHGALVGHIAVAEQNSRRRRRGAEVGRGFAARHPDVARVL